MTEAQRYALVVLAVDRDITFYSAVMNWNKNQLIVEFLDTAGSMSKYAVNPSGSTTVYEV